MDTPQSHIYEFAEFRLCAAKRLLSNGNGEAVPLTPKVFDTLLYLVEHNGKVVEKDELMRGIWADTIVEENNLSQNISILRRALGEKRGEHRFIATIPGRGFKFVADVSIRSEIQNSESARQTEIDDLTAAGRESNALLGNDYHSWKTNVFQPKKKSNRFWLATLVVSFILALGATAYFLRQNSNGSANGTKIKTIAVLPFKPLVAENRDESLEMGMADTLISRLGDNREIIVRPISSVRKYGGLEQDAAAAGRALAVNSVLDGNIQRWGDKIRVNVRLLQIPDGSLLWTGTFDEKFTDVFIVQDAIANRLAEALALTLSGEEQTKLEKRHTDSAEAYENYLRGRYHFYKLTQPEIRQALVFYQRAIEIDLNYALAYAGMADAYRTLAITTYTPSKEVCPQAKRLAMRALEIDPSLAEARVVLGWVGFLYEWNWKAAETELKKAIELSPNNSEAHRGYAHLLSVLGRHDEAVAEARRARELDPLTLITNLLEGQFLFYAGRDDDAIVRLNKTLELDPNFWQTHTVLGRIFTRQKRYDEAVSELTIARKLSGDSTEPVTQLGYVLAKAGRRSEAEAVLAELKSFAAEKYVPAYNFAMIYNGLNDRAESLNYLEQSFQEREVQMAFIKIDTRWDELRSEPRFIEIIKQMNFE